MKTNRNKFSDKIFILVISLIITAFSGFYPSKPIKGELFFYFGYYFILISVCLWAIRIVSLHREKIFKQFITHRSGLLLSFAILTAIFVIAPPQYKILNDEALLTGTSLSLYNHKTANETTHGVFTEVTPPTFSLLELDKRPLLYPFLLSALHSVTGYRAENSFILNFFCGVFILFISYAWVSEYFNRKLAVIGTILLSSTPAFVFWITSAGFEPLTLLMLMITFLLFYIFLKEKSVENAELLIFTFILLSQCRYEAIIFPAILFFFMVPFIYKNKYNDRWSYAACLSPFLTLPIIWQRIIFLDPYQSVLQSETSASAGFFSLNNFIAHVPKNIFVFLGLDPDYGFTPVLALFAIIGFYIVVKRIFEKRADSKPENRKIFFASLICVLVFSGIIFSHYFGDFTQPILHRVSILYLPFFTFYAIFGIKCLTEKLHLDKKQYILIILALSLFVLYWPHGARQNILRFLTIKNEYAKTMDYLKHNFPDPQNTLIFGDRQNLYTINGYNSEDIRWANANQIHCRKEIFPIMDHILFIQRYSRKTRQPIETCRTAPGFKLKHLTTIKLSYRAYLVISELNEFPEN